MEIEFNDTLYDKNLKPINLKIKSGEITSLLCDYNKFNILNYIYAKEIPIEGYIKIGTLRVRKKIKFNELKLLPQKIASLDFDLFNVTILDDIKLSLSKISNKKVIELLDMFDLNESILSKSYRELSEGEKSKIKIIILLLRDTKILIFNHPTKGLDNKAIQVLVREIIKLKKENKIVLILSYDTNFVLQVSDKVILIDNKCLILEGNKYDVMANEKKLKSINLNVPNIVKFTDVVYKLTNKKIGYRDNIKDTMKDVYRNAK